MLQFKFKTTGLTKKFPVKVLGCIAWIHESAFGQNQYQAYADSLIEQFWKRPFSHDLKYLFNQEYRLNCEILAMKAYLAVSDPLWYPSHVDFLSIVLARKCKLNKHESFRIISNL